MTATLVLPSHSYEKSYRDYIAELGQEERYPFQMDLDYRNFSALLERLRDFSDGVNIPSGYVRSSTYWLVDDQELVGVSSLRHHLNKEIMACGGHIGLGIRPSYRGKGLGNVLMALTIQEARKLGIKDIHIHCHESNEASVRMIVRNGGVLHSKIGVGEPTEVVLRYVLAAPNSSFKPTPHRSFS